MKLKVKHALLLFAALLFALFMWWATRESRPKVQIDFEDGRAAFVKKMAGSGNDVSRRAAAAAGHAWTANWANETGRKVQSWVGEVGSVHSADEGKSVALVVKSQAHGAQYEYQSASGVLRDTAAYDLMLTFHPGDKVAFSGVMQADQARGVREWSFTDAGSFSQPEIVVDFTSVGPLK